MEIFEYMERHGYEQLIYFQDKATGLKGITCIHNTTLGPALGGARLWDYASEEEATKDVFRLARAMTYKSAAAGLNLGGGKTVLIGDATKVKSEAYFRALGRYVQTLNGRYITAEDVNTSTKDMEYVSMETDYVVGLEGKSGNPSPFTAMGAFHGIKASLKYRFGDDDISKYTFAVQGCGQTGYYLINYLVEAKAKKIYFTEKNQEHIDRMIKEHPEVLFVKPDDIYGMEVDVFCPCAMGQVMNSHTIPKLKCSIVAGTANNVLEAENIHGPMLREQKILYAPDFVINSGGVINISNELKNYNKENVLAEIAKIYDRLLKVYEISDKEDVHTQAAAKVFARERMMKISLLRTNYVPR